MSRSAKRFFEGRTAALFDLDGTGREPCRGPGHNPEIPDEIQGVFRRMRRHGVFVGAATGRTWPEIEPLGLSVNAFWGEFGGHQLHFDDEEEHIHLPPETELGALGRIRDPVTRMLEELGGSFFPHNRTSLKWEVLGEHHESAVAIVRGVVCEAGACELLHVTHNPFDGGIDVVTMTVGQHGKGLAVRAVKSMGMQLAVAAGDSKADRPLLEAADFPILTILDDGHAPVPELADLVRSRGGFVATRPNWRGLLDGLHAARAAGVVSF